MDIFNSPFETLSKADVNMVIGLSILLDENLTQNTIMKAEANKILVDATKAIDMAASKGVFHKNNAARKVSRLTYSFRM